MDKELNRLQSKKSVQNNPFYQSLSKGSSIGFKSIKSILSDTSKNPFEKELSLPFDKNALQSSQSSIKNSSFFSKPNNTSRTRPKLLADTFLLATEPSIQSKSSYWYYDNNLDIEETPVYESTLKNENSVETLCDILAPIHIEEEEPTTHDFNQPEFIDEYNDIHQESEDDKSDVLVVEESELTQIVLPCLSIMSASHGVPFCNTSPCKIEPHSDEFPLKNDFISEYKEQDIQKDFIPLPSLQLLDLNTDFNSFMDLNESNIKEICPLEIPEPEITLDTKECIQQEKLYKGEIQVSDPKPTVSIEPIELPQGLDNIWDSSIFTDPISEIKDESFNQFKPCTLSSETLGTVEIDFLSSKMQSIKTQDRPEVVPRVIPQLIPPQLKVDEVILPKVDQKNNLPKKVVIKSPVKTRVSFGSACKGELESIKYINHHDVESEVEVGNLGICILQCNSISDLKLDGRRDEMIQIEIEYQNEFKKSQSVYIPCGQSKSHIGFESALTMNQLSNIHFKLLLLKETKPLLNWGTIRKSKTNKKEDITENIKKSASVMSLDANQNWSLLGKGTLETKEYLSKVGKVMERTMNLSSTKKQTVGQLTIQFVYIPLYTKKFDCVLPNKMEHVENAYQLSELHDKVWKKGYLFQKGGNCNEWKRHFYRLKGLKLSGYSNKKSDYVESFLDLSQLWSAEMLIQPQTMEWKGRALNLNVFELEFKDGIVIYLGVERKEGEESESQSWMEALGNVDSLLGDHPVPDWLLNCQK